MSSLDRSIKLKKILTLTTKQINYNSYETRIIVVRDRIFKIVVYSIFQELGIRKCCPPKFVQNNDSFDGEMYIDLVATRLIRSVIFIWDNEITDNERNSNDTKDHNSDSSDDNKISSKKRR